MKNDLEIMENQDNILIEEFLAGKEENFEILMKKYLTSLFNFVLLFVKDRQVAEDLVQESFVKVWKNLNRYDEKKKFKTWLFTIAKHTAFDYLKKKKAIPFAFFETEENPLLEIPDDNLLPDEILHREDVNQLVKETLDMLPENYRTVLELYYMQELTLKEIAEVLERSYNTIKSQYARALLKFKELLVDASE
jgi:RNA polymerase sigma-70 factor (ECF subfamily)